MPATAKPLINLTVGLPVPGNDRTEQTTHCFIVFVKQWKE